MFKVCILSLYKFAFTTTSTMFPKGDSDMTELQLQLGGQD